MERKPVADSPTPRYPSYEEFRTNRRKFLSLIGLGAGIAALGGVAGCDQSETAGVSPVPTQTVPAVDGEFPVSLPGEMMAPSPPPQIAGGITVAVPKEPKLLGDIAIAEPPVLRGTPPPPRLPAPPAPKVNKAPTPALGGVMCAPDPAP